MIWQRIDSVNVAALIGLSGCVADAPQVQPQAARLMEPTRVELNARVGPDQHGLPAPRPLPAAHIGQTRGPLTEAPRAALVDEGSILFSLGATLTDVSWAEDGGEAIDEALADFPAREVANYGAGLLTAIQLFGDPFHAPICDPPELEVALEDSDGQRWDAVLSLPQYTAFIDDLEPVMSALSSKCSAGLLTAGGDIEAAVDARACTEAEQHQFFEEGTDCGDCVAGNGGDFEACVDEDSCTEEAPEATWVTEDGKKAWYKLVSGVAWACRPDWLAPVYVLADVDPDGTLPESYDHARWNYYCFLIYDEASDSSSYACDGGDDPKLGHTLSEGIQGRTIAMTNRDGDTAFGARKYYSPKAELTSGSVLRWGWANSSNIGRLSKPFTIDDANGDGVVDVLDPGFGYPSGSWGFNPHALRPDGTDPTNVDDTFARDWLAMAALKDATTKDGVSIAVANHSRCESWEGPDEGGRYRCLDMGPPDEGWTNDALHYGYTMEDGQTYSYPVPITTIASTGLPDPDVPGGIVPLIAGSQRLAEADWEDCTWPNSFVADMVPFPDVAWDYEGSESQWGDSYNFDKDDGLDLRLVLNTNIPRRYCPEDL